MVLNEGMASCLPELQWIKVRIESICPAIRLASPPQLFLVQKNCRLQSVVHAGLLVVSVRTVTLQSDKFI